MIRAPKAIVIFAALSALAQQSNAPRVAVPLLARDSHHHAVTISADSLVVTDQKSTVAAVTLLKGSDVPLELGILVDTSRSQHDAHLDEVLLAAKEFAEEVVVKPDDRAFFLSFDITTKATRWLRKEDLSAIKIRVELSGGTALYDAVAVACKERMGVPDRNKPTRRVLIIISDGEDNQSHITKQEAVSDALSAGAIILAIHTGEANQTGVFAGKRSCTTLPRRRAASFTINLATKI